MYFLGKRTGVPIKNNSQQRLYNAVLLVFVLCFFLASCINLVIEKPSFIIRGISINLHSFTEANLIVDIDVKNINRFDLTLTSLEYTIYLNNEEIGSGRLKNDVFIPSSSTTNIHAPLTFNFGNLSKNLNFVFSNIDLPYKIDGKANVKTTFGSIVFPFSKKGNINLKG